jgi:hypothetical protein
MAVVKPVQHLKEPNKFVIVGKQKSSANQLREIAPMVSAHA